METSFRSTIARYDHLDRVLLVHCAATIQPVGFAGEVPSDLYQSSILLNTAAPMVLGHSFIESTDRLPSGTERVIVMMSSGSSSGVYLGWSSYKAGKGAVDEWVRTTALIHENAVPPLSILSIAPGVVATEMQEQIRATSLRDFPRRDKFEELYAKGALADAHDVAVRIWQVIEDRHSYPSLLDLRALPERS